MRSELKEDRTVLEGKKDLPGLPLHPHQQAQGGGIPGPLRPLNHGPALVYKARSR